jgi:solute carrier family 35 protein F5
MSLSRDRALGLGFVVLVSIIWVFASFLVQDLEVLGVHPIVVTSISNSLFSLYFPVYLLSTKLRQGGDELTPAEDPFGLPPVQDWLQDWKGSLDELRSNALFGAALHVAPLWFSAQLLFNASLSMTSVTSNTILSSSAALFTFLFSVILLSERFTYFKLACIFALMLGTAMVTASDALGSHGIHEGSSSTWSVWGDLICILSALFYGLYTVNIRRKIEGDDESVPMTLFFSFMGLAIALTTGPLLFLLWLIGVPLGKFSFPILGALVLKGLLDNVLSDYLWARSILLIGPTLATSGLALQVPIAVISDALLKGPLWVDSLLTTLLTLVGGGVILGAFFGLTSDNQLDDQDI